MENWVVSDVRLGQSCRGRALVVGSDPILVRGTYSGIGELHQRAVVDGLNVLL